MSGNNLLLFALANAGETGDANSAPEHTVTQYPMPWAGSVVALSGSLDTLEFPLATGSIQLRVTINGSPVGPVVNLTPAVQSEIEVIPAGAVPFLAGDGVGVQWVASADLDSGPDDLGRPIPEARALVVPWVVFAE